jgi:spermidine synthase
MEKNKVDKKDYEDIYDCIVTDQVSPDRQAEYLEDMEFYKYYIKRRTLGGLWRSSKKEQ